MLSLDDWSTLEKYPGHTLASCVNINDSYILLCYRSLKMFEQGKRIKDAQQELPDPWSNLSIACLWSKMHTTPKVQQPICPQHNLGLKLIKSEAKRDIVIVSMLNRAALFGGLGWGWVGIINVERRRSAHMNNLEKRSHEVAFIWCTIQAKEPRAHTYWRTFFPFNR